MYIYKTTRNSNGKYYIGKRETTPENDKWYYGSGLIIKHIIKKDGKENLTKDILMNNINTKEELCYWEQFWITVLDAQNKEYGYNIANGGSGGKTRYYTGKTYEEIYGIDKAKLLKEKLILAHLGHKHTEEQKNKIGLAQKGRKRSKETCINISKALTGKRYTKKVGKNGN